MSPVQKFRRIEDVPPPSPLPPDGRGLRYALDWCAVSISLAGWVAPVGIAKFRSITDAEADKPVSRSA